MAKKTTLTAETPQGVFTRTSANTYTHIVVRTSARSTKVYEGVQAGNPEMIKYAKSGVHRRWVKDLGFMVSWHRGLANAERAAAGPSDYDRDARVVGIYPVFDEKLIDEGVEVLDAIAKGEY